MGPSTAKNKRWVPLAEGKLIMVTTLTRHGTRAPNPVVMDICPRLYNSTTEIITAFGTAPGHLTQNGVRAMKSVGRWIRKQYVDSIHFMPSAYTNWGSIWSFRAIQAHRHLTSAAAIAQGIFPEEPVAIFSSPKVVDNLLATPPAACAEETKDHIIAWLATRGREFFRDPGREKIVSILNRVCGTSKDPEPLKNPVEVSTIIQNRAAAARRRARGVSKRKSISGSGLFAGPAQIEGPIPIPGNPHPAFQDVCDLLNFMHDQGIVRPEIRELTARLRQQCTLLSVDMMEARMYADDKTVARFCGLFPMSLLSSMEQMLDHLVAVADNRRRDPDFNEKPRFYVYVASRELLYGLAHYFGLRFEPVPGKPKNYIEAGTTFVWELHAGRNDESAPSVGGDAYGPDDVFVRMYYTFPSTSRRMPITITGCAADCPLRRFRDIVQSWNRRVGDLNSLCPVAKSGEDEKKLYKKEEKDEKKLAKKMMHDETEATVDDARSFEKSVEAFDRLEGADARRRRDDWPNHAAVVDAFCASCRDQAERCEELRSGSGVDQRDVREKMAIAERQEQASMRRSFDIDAYSHFASRKDVAAPQFAPVFACVTALSLFVALGLYYQQRGVSAGGFYQG